MALVTADFSCHAEGERMAALLEQFDPATLEQLGRQLAAIPLKVQAYLGLVVLGWSQRKIAELFDVRQQTVFDALSRWDPECIFRGNPKAVLAIRAALAMKMSAYGDGVPQDDKKAAKWFRLAAEQGKAAAQLELGLMYDHGEGVPEDNKEAVKWYRLAAEQGDADAQYQLGWMYNHGEGVSQDYVQSYAWLNLAITNGNATAKLLKDGLPQKMTPEQIARAQELSTELDNKINAAK